MVNILVLCNTTSRLLTVLSAQSRNLSLSLAAGNATIWKPSPTTPLCAIATTKIIAGVLEKNGINGAVAGLLCGAKEVGEGIVGSTGVDLGQHFFSIFVFERGV